MPIILTILLLTTSVFTYSQYSMLLTLTDSLYGQYDLFPLTHLLKYKQKPEKPTVCFMCFVEDVLLEILLLLHRGIQLCVIVLKEQNSHIFTQEQHKITQL